MELCAAISGAGSVKSRRGRNNPLTSSRKINNMEGQMKQKQAHGWQIIQFIGILFAMGLCFALSGCLARIPKESVLVSAEVSKGIAEGRRQHMATLDQVVEAKLETIELWMNEWFMKKLPVIAENRGLADELDAILNSFTGRKKFMDFTLDAAAGYAAMKNLKTSKVHKAKRKQSSKIREYWDVVLLNANFIRDNIKAVVDVQDIQDEILMKAGAPAVVIDPVGEFNKATENLLPEVKEKWENVK